MTSQRPLPPPRQGGNSTALRRLNERRLLTALRRLGQASKSDLSGQLNITQNAVGQIVQVLERQGLVSGVGRRMGQRGQPARLLQLNPDGAYAIGIKVGCRSTESLLVDFTGRVLQSRRSDSLFPDPAAALDLARRGALEAMRTLPAERRDRLEGIGLVLSPDLFAGSADAPGDARRAQLWLAADLPGQLRAALGCRLLVEQAGVAVAVSELFLGHGREIDDFACLYVNSTICGGIVLQGDYKRGVCDDRIIGLMPVAPSRIAPPPRGARHRRDSGPVQLRDRASGSSLFRHLAAHGVVAERAADLDSILDSHPRLVGDWLDDAADALLAPVLAIGGLLGPRAVILDGNLPVRLIDALLLRLDAGLAAAWPGRGDEPASGSAPGRAMGLRRGLAGTQAAALGAALLPLHYHHQESSRAEPAASHDMAGA